MSSAPQPPPRRRRPVLKRRTAALVLVLGLIVLGTGVLWLVASAWSARQLRLWGFAASAVVAPGVGMLSLGAGLLVWWWMGRRPR